MFHQLDIYGMECLAESHFNESFENPMCLKFRFRSQTGRSFFKKKIYIFLILLERSALEFHFQNFLGCRQSTPSGSATFRNFVPAAFQTTTTTTTTNKIELPGLPCRLPRSPWLLSIIRIFKFYPQKIRAHKLEPKLSFTSTN